MAKRSREDRFDPLLPKNNRKQATNNHNKEMINCGSNTLFMDIKEADDNNSCKMNSQKALLNDYNTIILRWWSSLLYYILIISIINLIFYFNNKEPHKFYRFSNLFPINSEINRSKLYSFYNSIVSSYHKNFLVALFLERGSWGSLHGVDGLEMLDHVGCGPGRILVGQ